MTSLLQNSFKHSKKDLTRSYGEIVFNMFDGKYRIRYFFGFEKVRGGCMQDFIGEKNGKNKEKTSL